MKCLHEVSIKDWKWYYLNVSKYFIGDLRSAFIYIIQQNAAAQKDEFPLIPVNSLFPLQRWEADEKSCFHAFSSRLLPTNPVSSVSCTEQHMTQMNSLRTCADLKATNGKIYSLEAKLFLLPVGWRCQRQIITVSGRMRSELQQCESLSLHLKQAL